MSVTIEDILKLPSLKGAKVVAGWDGLSRIINSITVMEAYDPIVLGKEKFGNQKSYGSEISITGFISIADNVQAQCVIVEKMALEGEAAIIIYYAGSIMKKIDQRIIDIGNKHGLTIIVMPEKRLELRYSDVICEVMEEIVKDKMAETNFVSGMIEQIAKLDKNRRNINSVLSILRDKVNCSFILLDEDMGVLVKEEWPVGRSLPLNEILENVIKQKRTAENVFRIELDGYDFWIINKFFSVKNNQWLNLVVIKENDLLTQDIVIQAIEVISTFLNLWTENYSTIDIRQLVNAVLQNEPEKMRRIAEILHIDIASISSVIVFIQKYKMPDEDIKLMCENIRNRVKEFFNEHNRDSIVEIYEDSVVVLIDNFSDIDMEEVERLVIGIDKVNLKAFCFDKLSSALQVKESYELVRTCEDVIGRIYLVKKIFTRGEVNFALRCYQICLEGGESKVREKKLVEVLFNEHSKDLLDTLAVFLLDGQLSFTKTAEIIFVHKNTVKYRIAVIEKILGYSMKKMPEIYDLSVAIAICRLDL